MTDVARAAALDGGDGAQEQPREEPAEAQEKLSQMKSELERLLQLQREWTETQQRKLQQKRELEQLLESHARQTAAPAPAVESQQESDAAHESQYIAGVTATPAAGNSELKRSLARREELRQLQEQTAAVLKRQQDNASFLAKKLEELGASATASSDANAGGAVSSTLQAATSATLPAKRKLAAVVAAVAQSGVQAAKRISPASARLHEFARAPASLTSSPAWERAALFRVATRYLLQTRQRISTKLLAEKCESYTGKPPSASQMPNAKLTGDAGVLVCRNAPWRPGGQSLAFPTFVSAERDDLVAFIDLEKRVVEQLCASVEHEPEANLPQAQRVQDALCQSVFFMNLTGFSTSSIGSKSSAKGAPAPPASIYHALSNAIGNSGAHEPAQLRCVRHHRFRQFSGLFVEMKAWLVAQHAGGKDDEDAGLTVDPVHRGKTLAQPISAAASCSKPFNLEHDSVFQQVRSFQQTQQPRKRKKLDPMNMLCLYELSGVCNDENCLYQHQKDFESSSDAEEDESKTSDDAQSSSSSEAQTPPLLSKEQMRLLQDFAHLRSKVTKKWPVITGRGVELAVQPASRKQATENSQSESGDTEPVRDSSAISTDGDRENDDGSFLQLEDESVDMHLDVNASTISGGGSSSRYCGADESMGFSARMLEDKVARSPTDTDSWLLLAILQLDFEVKLSDDATRISDSARLLGQLTSIHRCVHLSAFSSPVLDESKLKLSLHTLSRAIEVEANAYCEALWLLYLHLSSLLQKRDYDSEFEMAEQAMQLIPSSHRLWVHYMTVGKLDSIQLSEALHSRVLCHVAKPGSFQSHDNKANPNLSGLLTALVSHLCIKLCGAGSAQRAVELLRVLLLSATVEARQSSNSVSEAGDGTFGWCSTVRSQLSWKDVAMLSMVYAHLLLFDEIPAHIHKWLRVSGDDQQVHVAAFGFTVETFETHRARLANLLREDLEAAVSVYEVAFNAVKESVDADRSREYMDVVLNNRMILIAFVDTQEDRQEDASTQPALNGFLLENRELVSAFPGAMFTAAKLLASMPQQSQTRLARDLLTRMVSQSSKETFAEALHYYLASLRSAGASPDDPDLLDIAVRLATEQLHADHDRLARAATEIERETNPFGRVKALKKLLYGLLSAWMDKLAAASREAEKHQPAALSSVDIYVALDICQLMSVLLEPSVAIDGLELVLGSSKLRFLSAGSRQLAWTMRFALQFDAVTRENCSSQQPNKTAASSKAVRADLLQLLRRYMESMSMISESVAQATSRMSRAIEHEGIQSAIFECLYPQHSPWLLLEDNTDMFELCAAAIPVFELPSLYSSYHYWLSPSPRFCLGYAEIATHHWEWRKIRQGFRKCLADSSTHDAALQALVVLELKNQNMKSVARILEDELEADPLSMEAWRLVLGMEILFGSRASTGSSSTRAMELVAEITKRKLTVRASLFNDEELLDSSSSVREAKAKLEASRETGDFRSWGFCRIPNAVFMMGNLKALDLSGNFLVEIPESISRLTKLEVLNISQNALVVLPASLAKLSALRVLNVAHNNLSAIPGTLWLHLLQIQELDLRANMITHLPAPPLSRLQELRVLQIGDNMLSSENVGQLRQLLGSACSIGDLKSPTAANDERLTKSAGDDEAPSEMVPSTNIETQPVNAPDNDEEEDRMAIDDESVKPQLPSSPDDTDVAMMEDGENGAAESQHDAAREREHVAPEGTKTLEVDDQVAPELAQSNQDNNADDAEERSSASGDSSREPVAVSSALSSQPRLSTAEANEFEATLAANGELPAAEDALSSVQELTDRFEAYVNENRVSRALLKQKNPALWRKYVERQVCVCAGLANCAMCDLPNEGWNQRLNTMVLCPSCLRCAVEVVQARASTSSSEASESKEEN